jgi:hypothetical protein
LADLVEHGLLLGCYFDEEAEDIEQVEQFFDHYIVPPAKWDGIQLCWISTGRLTGPIPEPMADDPHDSHLVVPDRLWDTPHLSITHVEGLAYGLVAEASGYVVFIVGDVHDELRAASKGQSRRSRGPVGSRFDESLAVGVQPQHAATKLACPSEQVELRGKGNPDACAIHVGHKARGEPVVCGDSGDVGEEVDRPAGSRYSGNTLPPLCPR